jgi:hypothetical protein
MHRDAPPIIGEASPVPKAKKASSKRRITFAPTVCVVAPRTISNLSVESIEESGMCQLNLSPIKGSRDALSGMAACCSTRSNGGAFVPAAVGPTNGGFVQETSLNPSSSSVGSITAVSVSDEIAVLSGMSLERSTSSLSESCSFHVVTPVGAADEQHLLRQYMEAVRSTKGHGLSLRERLALQEKEGEEGDGSESDEK